MKDRIPILHGVRSFVLCHIISEAAARAAMASAGGAIICGASSARIAAVIIFGLCSPGDIAVEEYVARIRHGH